MSTVKPFCGHLCGLGASPPLSVMPRAREHTVNWWVGPQLPLENSSQIILVNIHFTSIDK